MDEFRLHRSGQKCYNRNNRTMHSSAKWGGKSEYQRYREYEKYFNKIN